MLALPFWKISPEGRAFIFMEVSLIAVTVMAVVVIIRVAVAVAMAAVVIAPGKGFEENPEKSSSRRKG